MASKHRNPAKPLSHQQERYCRNLAAGTMTKTDAYLDAYPRTKKPETARAAYTRLERDGRIAARVKELQSATETDLVLSRQEKREFLARVVRADLASLDETSDLVDSVTRRYDKEGNETAVVFKLPSKAQCIEIDNKMAGHNEPDEVNVQHSGGVMLVPVGGASLDAWEKEAVKQQDLLKGKQGAS